jgi:nitrate reductase gamma subunit
LGIGAVYVGLSLSAGVYLRRSFSGQLEARWMLFWPMILAACIIFWIGVYRKIISTNVKTFRMWERFLDRKGTEPRALLRRLWKDIVLQESLREQSKIRWTRHILIYWGFILLWVSDIAFAFLLEYLPLLGFPFISNIPHIRTVFKLFFECFGLMILAGASIAIIWGFTVRKTDERIFRDTPSAVFLFLVVFTGFIVEGLRFASLPDAPAMKYSFLGNFFASLIRGKDLSYGSLHQGGWYLHVILACAFIAYVPVRRLIHSCATPFGRLMQSQKGLLETRMKGVAGGLLQREEMGADENNRYGR